MRNPLDGVSQASPHAHKPVPAGGKAPTGMYQYFLKVTECVWLAMAAAPRES
jgi:hypothetical protein